MEETTHHLSWFFKKGHGVSQGFGHRHVGTYESKGFGVSFGNGNLGLSQGFSHTFGYDNKFPNGLSSGYGYPYRDGSGYGLTSYDDYLKASLHAERELDQ